MILKRVSRESPKRRCWISSIAGSLILVSFYYFLAHWPRYRDTRLLEASAAGDARTVRLLAHLGANLYGPYYSGVSPLMYAVRGDDKAVVQALIDAGDDPNNRENLTVDGGPVIAAVKTGDAELVRMLLAARAAKTLRDGDGKTALEHAREQRRPDIESLLTPTGPK